MKVPDFRTLAIGMARFIAATPNSCDVERLISRYTLLNDDLRSSLSPDTVRDDLHTQFNVPVLSEFDPRPAVKMWLTGADRRPGKKAPSTSVSYFKGVFSEANKADDSVMEDYDLD